MAAEERKTDVVKMDDGSEMQIARLPEVDNNTWGEMKRYLETNPEIANGLRDFSQNPDAMRGWLQTQVFAEHYQASLGSNDAKIRERLEILQNDQEVKHVFEDIRKNGLDAAIKYWDDEDILEAISSKMGGVPEELSDALARIDVTPLSFHEASKLGDLRAVAEYLRKSQPVDAQDSKGITPLGYAVGRNQLVVAKALLQASASPHAVDSSANNALHYAAGYGHVELLRVMLKSDASVNQVNTRGQTPSAVASVNKHLDGTRECGEILSRGARAAS